MIAIDGSYGEGGGQVIRTSLSLAAITGQAVEFRNVRARRSKPGLQPQHLAAVRAAASLCAAELEGDAVGSSRVRFRPQAPVAAGNYRFEIGTAGATNLVAQTVLLPLSTAGAPSTVRITGGTHVPHSPPAEYLEAVYLPALRRADLEAEISYERLGFYPRGGGYLLLHISPSPLLPLSPSALDLTDRGKLRDLTAYIVTAGLPDHVAERGAATVERYMKSIGRTVRIERRDRPSLSAGAAVILAAEGEGGLAGFTSLGERGKPMEKVAEQACDEFLAWWKTGAAMDEHLADQLVLPLALAPGESRWTTPTVTEHLRTVLWVTQHFLPIRFTLEEPPNAPAVVMLRGAPLP